MIQIWGVIWQRIVLFSFTSPRAKLLKVSNLHHRKFIRASLWVESGPQFTFSLIKWGDEKCHSASHLSPLDQHIDSAKIVPIANLFNLFMSWFSLHVNWDKQDLAPKIVGRIKCANNILIQHAVSGSGQELKLFSISVI